MPLVMPLNRKLLSVLISFLLAKIATAASSVDDCKDLGFTGTQLCGDCDKLQEYVKDEGLAQECKSWCIGDGGGQQQLFENAILEVCKHRLREFPQVEGFIKREAAAFTNLKVVNKFGTSPRLIFKGASKQKETIRIDSWTTDNVKEYIDSKLAKPAVQQS